MAKLANIEIVKHDGEFYKKEERRAEVGELVEVFGHVCREANGIFRVTSHFQGGEDDKAINYECKNYGTPYHNGKAYSVLVPLVGSVVTIDGAEYTVSSEPAREGDKALIVDELAKYEDYETGRFYEVTEDADSDGDIYVNDDEVEDSLVYYNEYLTLKAVAPVSSKTIDEEIAETKTKLAELEEKKEAEKWAAIGRKVGEFRLGDVVRVTGSNGGHPVGTIGKIVSGAHFTFPREFGVRADGKIYDHTEGGFELVAPVESLFNKTA